MSFDLKKFLTENKLTKTSKLVKEAITVNGREVDSSSIQVDGVDPSDYPDFSDAYIAYAEFMDGTPLNDDELSELDDYAHQFAFDTLLEMQSKNNLKENNMSFDLKKFLTENKLTKSSRLAENDLAFEAEEMQAPVAEEPAAEGVDVSRYLNLESADDVVKEIESEVARVTMEAKISKIKEVIEAIETKANGLEEDANLEGFVNPTRIKEMRRMTKKLRMMQERYTKEYERKFKEGKKKKLNEQSEDLAGELSRLYDQILALPRKYRRNRYVAIDDVAMDEEMERIVGQSFAFGRHPEWNRLTDEQLMMLKPFLEAVLSDEEYSEGGRWTGSEVEYEDNEMSFDYNEQNEESDLKIRTVSRADAGKAIRGTTQKKPMVGADYKGMKDTQVQTVKRPVAFRAMKDAKDGLGPQYKK